MFLRTKVGLTLLAAAGACGVRDVDSSAPSLGSPSRPDGAIDVAVGEDLQARLDAAPEGATLALAAGRHAGPIVLRKPVTLWGSREAVIVGADAGCTVAVEAPHVRLLGFTVDGSGNRYDLLDAAVRVQGDDGLVDGLTVRHALFGILVEKASRVVVRGNLVEGTGEEALGLRGDTIRLWETRDCVVEANHVRDGRDMVVWYSKRTRVLRNQVERGRYGTHFMYSDDHCTVEGNRYDDERRRRVRDVQPPMSNCARTRSSRCSGAAGMGIGLKDSGEDHSALATGFAGEHARALRRHLATRRRDEHNTHRGQPDFALSRDRDRRSTAAQRRNSDPGQRASATTSSRCASMAAATHSRRPAGTANSLRRLRGLRPRRRRRGRRPLRGAQLLERPHLAAPGAGLLRVDPGARAGRRGEPHRAPLLPSDHPGRPPPPRPRAGETLTCASSSETWPEASATSPRSGE
jgi:hypothetical protein